jgi:phenylacetic acid degradation operon negative regulatory protein
MQLRNTQANRQLTARSVIASTLLGTEPPALPGRVLVSAAALFGITEGATRVALSRMVTAGELATDDGRYMLVSPRLLARQARQTASRRATTTQWDGRWVLAVVIAERRDAADRAELRERLGAARLAELREGVWTRPDNIDIAWPDVVTEHCTLVTDATVDAAVAPRLWDLDRWALDADDLRRQMDALITPLESGDTDALAPGFVTSAAVLRQLQADPLLPAELLPRVWPGDAIRTEYDRFDAGYRAVLRSWFRSTT